ncbi:MAG: response regulator transcription factor [Dehalococcoidia bacterium]|nr:response regulator transcription factor [Dehalococcoidia bacterium]
MHQDLSPQERRVVAAVAEGKTNKQKNYVANAMHKADVDNRTLLALWWRQHEQAANG